MKKKLLLIVFTLLAILALSQIANAEATEWTVSDDMSSIVVDGQGYTLYDVPIYASDLPLPKATFVYENYIYRYELRRNYEENGIFFLYNTYFEEYQIYTNEDGKAILDEFFLGSFSSYKLYNDAFGWASPLDLDFIKGLDGNTTQKLNVKDLAKYSYYEILGFDKTATMAHIMGAIYFLETDYYYINYDSLDNSYFDADGNFSYRSGSVTAYKLSSDQIALTKECASYMSKATEYKYEGSELSADGIGMNRGFAIAIFVIFTAVFGFIIPIAPMVFGIIRLCTKKSKNPKRWYLMITALGLWVLFAIGTLLALII